MKRNRCYSELVKLPTFEERFEYLRLDGTVCEETFGSDRYLNQMFYRTQEWKRARDLVIVRDGACDLGVKGYEILGYDDKDKRYHPPKIYIHHMIPISKKQILDRDPIIYNPEYLITCTLATHNAIHYGDETGIMTGPIIRKQNDTCPWKH